MLLSSLMTVEGCMPAKCIHLNVNTCSLCLLDDKQVAKKYFAVSGIK